MIQVTSRTLYDWETTEDVALCDTEDTRRQKEEEEIEDNQSLHQGCSE